MKENLFKKLQNLFGAGDKISANITDSSTDVFDDDSYIDDLLNSEESVRLTSLSQPSQTSFNK